MARSLIPGLASLPTGTRWLVWVCFAALAQIAMGLAGLAAIASGVEWEAPTAVQSWQRLLAIVCLGALAAYLLRGASRDARQAALGTLFLLIALFFAHPPSLALLSIVPDPFARPLTLVRSAPIDAFTPAVSWLFVREFPRALESWRSAVLVRSAVQLSVVAALALIGVNLAIAIRGEPGALAAFDRNDAFGHYWTVVFGLLLPTLVFVPWRVRHAPDDERRRVRLFAVSIALLCVFPVLLAVVPPWFPVLAEQVLGDVGARILIPINLLLILSMAGATAYSVAVRRVFDVRTVLRKAAQYSLTRLVVGVLAGVPFGLLVTEIYRARDQPLGALFSGSRLVWVVGALAAFVLVLRLRRRVMLTIDRIFFREPYDAAAMLASVAGSSRAEGPVGDWARSLVGEIDAAMHVESAGLIVAGNEDEDFHAAVGALRRLPRTASIVDRLTERAAPVRVGLEPLGDWVRSLPQAERVWLADAAAELLIPLSGSDGRLLGILVLGPKRSELPFSREDLLVLEAVSGPAAIALENRLLRRSQSVRGDAGAAEDRAVECTACSHVDPPGVAMCSECGGRVQPCRLPRNLFGKFELQKRIGEGGMGVVYLATDVTLGRSVALKTLPVTSPEDAGRLRREARAMASITHPNLALILGFEAWKGTPILVLEYLSGGTLEDRMQSGPFSIGEAFDLIGTIANVLQRAHRAGILHRDVKPSNIGFDADAVPKLLDFGLARIVGDATAGRLPGFAGQQTETGLAGTPLYMCPEAFDAERPQVGFDLWSLGVVGFEAVTGCHPFHRPDAPDTMQAIRAGWTDELCTLLPEGAAGAAEFFARVLAADRSRRPASAAEMAAWAAAALGLSAAA